MPTFHYTAKRGPHDVVEGTVDADNRGGVLSYLAERGYVPVRVVEQSTQTPDADSLRPAAAPSRVVGRVPSGHLTAFTRQFASLVRSSVPLLRAMKILEEQAKHPGMRHILHELAEAVRQGDTLSSAMAKFPRTFSALYVNLIHSGEVSGAMDVILDRLATQAEQDEVMRARIRAAFVYPAFVGVVGMLTVVFLMTFVMPRLSSLLSGLGGRLPLATRLLLAMVEWMSTPWWWAGSLGAAAVAALWWRVSGVRGRLALDRLILRLPLVGPVVRQNELSRFARSLGLQITHGIPVLQAIEVSASVVDHRIIRSELGRLAEGLRQGRPLSACLQGTSISTPLLVNTIAVGEESGRVGEALGEVSAFYDRETERLLQTLATLLEPALILGVGLFVGFIVMAVLLPIFEMSGINP